MSQQIDAYTVQRSGDGYEIVSPNGTVIAWAVGAATAQAIVSLLNLAHVSGLLDLDDEAGLIE